MRKRNTIKDVARRAEVGHSTVSRVIHNHKCVDPMTRERVQKAIDELGYRPNLIARGLVRQRTRAIALVVPALQPHMHAIIDSVAERCAADDYAVLLYRSVTWQEETSSFQWIDQNWLVDGILVYSLLHHEQVPADILELQSAGLPFVFINNFLHTPGLNAVGVDNKEAVFQVVQHLADLGHRRIAILNGHRRSVDGAERYAGFQSAMQRLGLPFAEELVREGVWEVDIARKEMAGLLSLSHRPTAVFCANDHMALGVIQAAWDAGLEVPKDIAIAGFDDLEAGRYFTPALTTIHPPLWEVSVQAVDVLMKAIAQPDRPTEQQLLKGRLIVRDSTVQKTA